jgi:hypothetical protein
MAGRSLPLRLLLLLSLLLSLLVGWTAVPEAIQVALDRRAIEEALAIGQSRITVERSRFHAPYRIAVGKAPLDMIHVVTPFRRIVLAAEERVQSGGTSIGQKEALQALADAPDQLDLYIELTFHPLNTYIGVPAYDAALLVPGTSRRVEPKSLDRFPRYGPRVEGGLLPSTGGSSLTLPRQGQTLLGGTLIARFDIQLLEPAGVVELSVSEAGKELARARLDLAPLR